ncbi:hypothetical protein SKAU_G00274590 [Synaphobranchus kaupii]|uniref:Uncharacterized protein n=1 Tax=Synaphobranchus kaupii TaxID=118154 RepID=A0A9Q1IQ13_SYNKA|nr:hypothetical protein SKAU_G00274590 [Synaphobranchus kaupii]
MRRCHRGRGNGAAAMNHPAGELAEIPQRAAGGSQQAVQAARGTEQHRHPLSISRRAGKIAPRESGR